MTAKLVKWVNLGSVAKAEVRRWYVNWYHDRTARTFDDWANTHAFYVRHDGRLDRRYRHCEPDFLAD